MTLHERLVAAGVPCVHIGSAPPWADPFHEQDDAGPYDPGYTVRPARYAKGQFSVHCRKAPHGFKTRAMRLLEHLNARYSNREGAYIISAAKVRKLDRLFTTGRDACAVTRQLIPS